MKVGKPRATLAIELAERCGEILHGHHPDVQGAALCDLTATWIAGHVVGGASEEFVEFIIRNHIEQMRRLIVVNVEMIKEKMIDMPGTRQ